MIGDRRRGPVDGELLRRVLLAWAMTCSLLLMANFGAIRALRFPDPDDILRLVQVRDLLAGQSWFDLTQHRVNAVGGGVPMHWSRLVDIPLLIVIGALTPLVGQAAAEMTALIVVPLLTFGCALFLAGRLAWRVCGEEAAGFACLAMALSVPVIAQLRPLRIDHHGWQIVCVLAAANGLMARNPRVGGWVVGGALATGLAISIEGVPLAAAICGILALRWLGDRARRMWLVSAMQALAAVSAALFLATRDLADMAPHCDAIAPVHLAIFGWGTLIITALAVFEPHPRGLTLAGFGLAAGGAGAILWLAAPQCLGGGFADLDPVVRAFWLDGIGEGLPLWRQPAGQILQTAIPPLIGIYTALHLAGRSHDWLRRWWIEYTILLVAVLAIAVAVTRAGAVAGALAAVPLGWQIKEWIKGARNMRRPGKRALALAGVAVALLPALPVTLLTLAMPVEARSPATVPAALSCNIAAANVTLARLPTGEVLAPMDIGPDLLLGTRHRVIATSHHRGARGMRLVIGAFRGSPGEARRMLRERGTAYVALCPALMETALYRDSAPDGFAARLMNGQTPAWLGPVDVGTDTGLLFWRVRN